jgi:FkbM family methyltransferase
VEKFEFVFQGKSINFIVNNPRDIIQAYHSKGTVYEFNQLIRHLDLIWHASTVLDIGSNIGNHALFYGQFSRASLIYVFEPNESARSLLLQNITINPSIQHKFNLEYSALGLSSSSGHAYIGNEPIDNLGATKVVEDVLRSKDQVPIRLTSIDELDIQGKVSFVKIDTEGHEIKVLLGGQKFFSCVRPTLAIEVGWWNDKEFWKWTVEYRYKVVALFQDTDGVKNYVCIPAY